jgi:2'-5' RNA ligase
MNNNGYFIVADLEGALREQIAEVQRTFDPRLAASSPPHITITGSSGVGPIALDTTAGEIRTALEPILVSTPPMQLGFGPPIRFMQSNIVVLPLDPHGPLRTLHDRIAQSGLRFGRARFTFTPHVTLSFFPVLSRDTERALLAVHPVAPAAVRRLTVYRSINPMPYQSVVALPLLGTGTAP